MHHFYLSLLPQHLSLSKAALMCLHQLDGPWNFAVQRPLEISLSLGSDEGLAGVFLLYQNERPLEKQVQCLKALLENHRLTS
jgi:hypothetical protein